jgi:hypothetical protein
MSKILLKKHLQSQSKEQIIEQVLELYNSYKPVKEYFTFYLNPNEQGMFEKYKAVIVDEFYPKTKSFNPKTRFSVAKKAIADFSKFKPSPELIGDLMVTFVENACQFTFEFGDMWEQYYDSTATNFNQTLKFLHKNKLLDNFKLRIKKCVKYAKPCGYGFADEIRDLYLEYFED